MNYAEEQLQNAMKNELKTIKSRNVELLIENEQLNLENDEWNAKYKNMNESFDLKLLENETLTDNNKELKDMVKKLVNLL